MLQLKVNYECPPIPNRGADYQVSEKEWDLGKVIGNGRDIPSALEDFINQYESKHDIDRRNIKYKWS
jgi:predicted RNA-binding protein YlqC (UPF0109 family)